MFKSCKVKIKNDQIWTYTVFRKPRASNLNIFYVCLYIRSHFYAFPFLLHSSFKKSSIFLSSSSLLIDPYSIKCNKKTSFFWLIIKISSNYMDYHDPLTLGCLFRSYYFLPRSIQLPPRLLVVSEQLALTPTLGFSAHWTDKAVWL